MYHNTTPYQRFPVCVVLCFEELRQTKTAAAWWVNSDVCLNIKKNLEKLIYQRLGSVSFSTLPSSQKCLDLNGCPVFCHKYALSLTQTSLFLHILRLNAVNEPTWKLPGRRPLALCSGLLGFSLLDRLSGSWTMPSVCGGAWLRGDVETSADPSKIESVKERSRERHRVEKAKSKQKEKRGIMTSAGELYFLKLSFLYTHWCVWAEQGRHKRSWGDLWEVTWALAGSSWRLQQLPTLQLWKPGKLLERNMRNCEKRAKQKVKENSFYVCS